MGMTERYQDWSFRLHIFVHRHGASAFVRGRLDCALFAADWVREATGVDHAAEFRGRYRSKRGAVRALRQHGTGTLAETVTAKLGRPLRTHLLAQRGDVVMVDLRPGDAADPADVDRYSLGVCLGAMVACLSVEGGLVPAPLADGVTAWRV